MKIRNYAKRTILIDNLLSTSLVSSSTFDYFIIVIDFKCEFMYLDLEENDYYLVGEDDSPSYDLDNWVLIM